YLPENMRVAITRKHLGPWGPWWLADRFTGKVPIVPFSRVIGAKPHGDRLQLRVQDTNTRDVREMIVDHLVAGTGYQPDVDRISFIDRALAVQIARIDRGPRVSSNFESSVAGLYFVGPVTALSFGPLLRFVAGAKHSSRTVARHLARDRSEYSA